MKRRKWNAAVVLAAALAAVAVYLSPYVSARANLPHLSAQTIFDRSSTALKHDAFAEVLSYRNNLVPPEINWARAFNLPLPDAGVQTIALYQNSPAAWRFEEMNGNNAVVGVVARSHDQLVTYQSSNNHRTVEALPPRFSAPWSLWQVPAEAAWRGQWLAVVSTQRLAGHPAYRITLKPRRPGTLIGRVIYWFDGRTFLPLGVEVTDKASAPVFSARLLSLSTGPQKASAKPPTAGRLVTWKVPPTVLSTASRISRAGRAGRPEPFPGRLGPLHRVSERQAGGNSLAVYGTGPGRVVVIGTSARVFKGQAGARFFHPVAGYAHFEGVTDGIFTVVTFHRSGREIALLSSRSQQQLARWAEAAWG